MEARQLGAAAVLLKFTGKPTATATEVYQLVRGVCALQALPVFYDHCPARTGVDLGTHEIGQILAIPGMAGIREAPANLTEVEEHLRLCRGMNRAFFTASALTMAQFLEAGGCGAMCPEAVLLPTPIVKAYRAFVAGRHDETLAMQEEFYKLA